MSEKKHALTILAAAGKNALGADLTKAGTAINSQLALIRDADPLIAKRAIFVGTALLMVKESLAHGEFGPWLDKHIDDLGRRQVQYYMRLAIETLDAERVNQKALAALPVGEIESALTVSKGPAGEFRAAVDNFVGGKSLSELLAEHGIKGGTKKAGAKKGDEAGAAHAVNVQDRFNELDQALQVARKGAADKTLWMSLSKQQHEDLRAAAEATADFITTLYVKTHGRKKA